MARPMVLDEAWITANASSGRIGVFGDGADKAEALWEAHEQVWHAPGIVPSARFMVPLASDRLASGKVDDLAYLVPAYGKAANVGKQPLQAGQDGQ